MKDVLAKIHWLETHFNTSLHQLRDLFNGTLQQELSKMAENNILLHTSFTDHSLKIEKALEKVIVLLTIVQSTVSDPERLFPDPDPILRVFPNPIPDPGQNIPFLQSRRKKNFLFIYQCFKSLNIY